MRRSSKKGVTDIPGLSTMRTLHSTGRRSIPRGNQSSAYIDLYMLTKEKERLEKEVSMIGRRNRIIERRLEDIEKETVALKAREAKKLTGGAIAVRKSIPAVEGRTPKDWKRMALHF